MNTPDQPRFISDFHIHGIGHDSLVPVRRIINAAKLRNLDGVAITNHHSDKTYPKAAPLAELAGVQLFPGTEVSTILKWNRFPHLIFLYADPGGADDFFNRYPIPIFPTSSKAFEYVADHPEITALVPHSSPKGDIYSFSFDEITEAKKRYGIKFALEVVNEGLPEDPRKTKAYLERCKQRYEYATAQGIPMTGGSDAHRPKYIGDAVTVLYERPKTRQDALDQIKSGQSGFALLQPNNQRLHVPIFNGVASTMAAVTR